MAHVFSLRRTLLDLLCPIRLVHLLWCVAPTRFQVASHVCGRDIPTKRRRCETTHAARTLPRRVQPQTGVMLFGVSSPATPCQSQCASPLRKTLAKRSAQQGRAVCRGGGSGGQKRVCRRVRPLALCSEYSRNQNQGNPRR